MNRKQIASMGAKAKNEKYKLIRIKEYLENPKKCINCGNPLLPKTNQNICEIKKKKFCSQSCSATFSNGKRRKKEKIERVIIPRFRNRDVTKQELFGKRKNWQSARSAIRTDACLAIEKSGVEKKCAVCGYDTHVEVCHLTSVSSFPDNATLKEINSLDNLIYLCPNHHWEFDNIK